MVSSTNHLYLMKMTSAPSHVNSEFELILVNSGSVRVQLENNAFDLTAGQIAVILPFKLHSFSVADKSDALVYMFPLSMMSDFFSLFRNCEITPASLTPDSDTLSYFKKLTDQYRYHADQGNTCSSFSEKALLYTVLAEFTHNCHLQPITFHDAHISRIIEYAYMNMHQPITVKSITKEFCIDDEQLNLMFQSYCGLSFKDFLNSMRIHIASQLLEYKDLTVTQIAFDVGFESQRTFNRTFRRIMGTTPTEFRQNARAVSCRLPQT